MSALIEKKRRQKLAEQLSKKTHFSKKEIENILEVYRDLTQGKLDRSNFRVFLHKCWGITDDVIMDRMFRGFDQDNDSYINMEEWVRGLSVSLRGNLEEHKKFCFEVYDLNGDGYISREEIITLLKYAVVKLSNDEDPEEGLRELVDMSLRRLDTDGDHRVSFPDFSSAVDQEPLMLEALGVCLPCEQYIRSFDELIK